MILYIILAWTAIGAIGVLGLNPNKLSLSDLIEMMIKMAILGPYGFYLGLRCYLYNRAYRRKNGGQNADR